MTFSLALRSIRRVIFHSLMKPTINEKGEKEIDVISSSQARQIAGRAGRHGTKWEEVSEEGCTITTDTIGHGRTSRHYL